MFEACGRGIAGSTLGQTVALRLSARQACTGSRQQPNLTLSDDPPSGAAKKGLMQLILHNPTFGTFHLERTENSPTAAATAVLSNIAAGRPITARRENIYQALSSTPFRQYIFQYGVDSANWMVEIADDS